jgi:sugar O-acyltransferase (sialic acid O-acetyltransferase NeuD family)|tara:strand:- start:170 stop:781 length:612 start_codon:yes stop_codon:yes gene_type:complete
MDEIILVGSGGHARSCVDVIELSGHFKIAGLIEKDHTNSQENLGYPIIGTDDDLPDLRQDYEVALVTVGQINSAATRVRLFNMLNDLKYKLPVIVSPIAYVSKHAKIGDGTIVMHNVMINANAKIGKNCIINNKTLIEHDAVIGDHCHISTGAIVNGEVQVGEGTFIGSGAVTKQSVGIGSRCVIGAGAVIKTDVESNQVIKN